MFWAVLASLAIVYTGGAIITYGLLIRKPDPTPRYRPRHSSLPQPVSRQRAHNRLRRPPRPLTDALRWPLLLAAAFARARSDDRSPRLKEGTSTWRHASVCAVSNTPPSPSPPPHGPAASTRPNRESK